MTGDFTAAEIPEAVKDYLVAHVKPSRIEHTKGVVKTAEELSRRFGADPAKAMTASWFHDMARNLPIEKLDSYVLSFDLGRRLLGNPDLSHSKVAAALMKRDFGVRDQEILDAVAFHTTARAGMGPVEKVVFLADAIEPGRSYPGVDEIREEALRDLDRACLMSLEGTIGFLREKGVYIDPDTIEARDHFAEIIKG